jgi:hypothetical protein
MRGRIEWSSPPGGGTEVTVDVTLRGRNADDVHDTAAAVQG